MHIGLLIYDICLPASAHAADSVTGTVAGLCWCPLAIKEHDHATYGPEETTGCVGGIIDEESWDDKNV